MTERARGSLLALPILLLAGLVSIARANASDLLLEASSAIAAAASSTSTSFTRNLETGPSGDFAAREQHPSTTSAATSTPPHPTLYVPTTSSRLVAQADDIRQPCEDCSDKVVLVVLEMLGAGVLGIDRFYVRDYVGGALKLVTLGGCGIWFVVDWFGVMINALERKSSIDHMGIKATFHETGTKTARTLSVIAVASTSAGCFFCCCSWCLAVLALFFSRRSGDFMGMHRSSREMSGPGDDLFAEEDPLHEVGQYQY